MTEPATPRTSHTALWVVLTIAIAGAVGIAVERSLRGHPPAEAQPAAAAANADPGPAPEDAAAGDALPHKVPEVLPQFELKDRSGKLRKLGDWKGRPLMVNYWATWCPPCVREIPLLSQLRHERQKERLEVIGIAVDFRDDVLKFADEHQLDYPLLIGEEDGLAAVEAVGMSTALPFTLFADSRQRIVALKIGELHHDEAVLILDRVAAVDTGTLDLAAAREQIAEGLKELATRHGLEQAAGAAAPASTPG
ncbi:MAG: TlpA disulfide reductase family protein [Steroidobacteraceae bacterium]